MIFPSATGAPVTDALTSAGRAEVTRRFFHFCHQVITPEGYLLHKYNPDGSIASSWHVWYQEGRMELPVQEEGVDAHLWRPEDERFVTHRGAPGG